jgi:hypothetical protein
LDERIDQAIIGGQLTIEHQHGEAMNEGPSS